MEKRSTCLTVISFLLIASGLLLSISSTKIFHIILDKLLDLTPGELLFAEWMKPAPEMIFDVHFFNWTNPEEFSDASKKPAFNEVGPFRFVVRVEKTNVTFNPLNDTMTYNLHRWYKFNRAESVHGLDYNVTVLNMLSTAAAEKVKDMNYFVRKGISLTLSSASSIHMTKTVGELLFDGTQDSILDLFRRIPMGVPIPDKFGFFYKKNGSSEGSFNIGTGHGNHKLGTLYAWNGKSVAKDYGATCNNFSGAAMDFYTGNMENNKVVIFNPALCRKFPLDYSGKSKVHGIEGYRYEADDSLLDNGTIIPGNECYCDDQCIGYGAIPATLCQGRANSYLTLPHFLKADPIYASKIEGMRPNPKKHRFQLVIEPTTGILLKLRARLQMNVYVKPVPSISIMENAPTALIPIVWFENSLKIPEDGAFSIGILLSFKGVFICIGIILAIIGILIYMLFVFELRRNSKLANEDYEYELASEMAPLDKKR